MKYTLLSSLLILIAMSCSNKDIAHPIECYIKGESDIFEEGTVKIINISNPEKRGEVLDSAEIKDFKFELNLGAINGIIPMNITLQNKTKSSSSSGLVLVSNGQISCDHNQGNFHFSGNAVQDTFTSVTDGFIGLIEKYGLYSKSNLDSFDIVANQLFLNTYSLIDRHEQSPYSLFAYSIATNYLAMKFGDAYYSKFQKFCSDTIDMQENVWKYNFCRQIKLISSLEEGKKLNPSFTLDNVSGNKISLSDINAKCILLDFWAYWCTPCIKDIPKLKEMYKKYNSAGLEIVSISTDQNLKPWKRSVKKHNTPWPQLMDTGDQSKSISMKLNVGPIPRYIILDRNYQILHFDVDSQDLEKLIVETLSK